MTTPSAIAGALAALTGGAAALLDADGGVVASAGGPVPCLPGRRAAGAAVEAVDACGRPVRIAAGVHGPLGYAGAVVALATTAPLPADALPAVAEAAEVAARYLTPYREPAGEPAVPEAPYVVVAFAADVEPLLLAAAVRTAWSARGGPVGSAVADGQAYVLAEPATAARTAESVVADAERVLRVAVHAGVGPVVEGAAALPDARLVAARVVRVGRERGDRVARLDGVRPDVLLLALGEAVTEQRVALPGVLAPLRAHDEAHQTEYVRTLGAYLDAFGDVTAAAERIRVHPRTFRHRLRRIGELSAIRLDDPDERLAAHLELRLGDA
ncbi:MAG TPA: helix-turn-helix domain-containing protein [Frankiaceae bacterium]|nr:helix-turn-helix domain-containing protein [Frankiaceae bacterium]